MITLPHTLTHAERSMIEPAVSRIAQAQFELRAAQEDLAMRVALLAGGSARLNTQTWTLSAMATPNADGS